MSSTILLPGDKCLLCERRYDQHYANNMCDMYDERDAFTPIPPTGNEPTKGKFYSLISSTDELLNSIKKGSVKDVEVPEPTANVCTKPNCDCADFEAKHMGTDEIFSYPCLKAGRVKTKRPVGEKETPPQPDSPYSMQGTVPQHLYYDRNFIGVIYKCENGTKLIEYIDDLLREVAELKASLKDAVDQLIAERGKANRLQSEVDTLMEAIDGLRTEVDQLRMDKAVMKDKIIRLDHMINELINDHI